MYQGGHQLTSGTMAENVAAQRAFFNFGFSGPIEKNPLVGNNIPSIVTSGCPESLIASVTSRVSNTFTFEWSSTCGGTFGSPTAQTTTFIPPTVLVPTQCLVSIRVTDACGRVGFSTVPVTVIPAPGAPVAMDDIVGTLPNQPTTIDATLNDADPNLDPLTLSLIPPVTTPSGGVFTDNGNGTVTYTPAIGFLGVDSVQYQVCDTGFTGPCYPASPPLCDNAWIYVTVSFDDYDGDGLSNDIDIDDENDGIPDILENVFGIDPSADHDSDNIPNYEDPDLPQCGGLNAGVCSNFDSDQDGIPDHFDVDSDNDGIPDAQEANLGQIPSGYVALSATISGSVGANGMPDIVETVPESGISIYAMADSDGDGILDFQDLDSDGDGLTDNKEAGGADANGDGRVDGFRDTDGDGWDDGVAAVPLLVPNTDGTGLRDFLDIDADGDGIIDNIEAQSTAGYAPPTGLDGDGDGIDNAYDFSNGGTAILTACDFDTDGTPDYRDMDSDNDGAPDLTEGHDPDSDGTPNTAPIGSDTDNDGLDNAFDPDQIVCGVGGLGQPGNGGCAALQNTDALDDRDWRDFDDDNDLIPTIGELPDRDLNLIADYLEFSCPPGEVAVAANDNKVSDKVKTALSITNANDAIDGVNGQAAELNSISDTLVIEMSGTVPAGATVTVHALAGNHWVIETSTNLAGPWRLEANNVNATPNYFFGAGDEFKFVRVTQGQSGVHQLDAIDARWGTYFCGAGITAVDDYFQGAENTDALMEVVPNDTDYIGRGLFVSVITNPTRGSTTVLVDSAILYTPNLNFSGTDSLQYQICSPYGVCDTANIYISPFIPILVLPEHLPPLLLLRIRCMPL